MIINVAFSECQNRTYGLDCNETCSHCKDGAECDIETGNCPGGQCNAGYWGIKCDQGEYMIIFVTGLLILSSDIIANRNGSHLVDFLLEHSLIAANTQFLKRKGKLWTFKHRASDSLKHLDYILTHRKWRNSVRNVEAFNHFHMLRSDHRVVTSSIKLSLRAPKHKKHIKFDWH